MNSFEVPSPKEKGPGRIVLEKEDVRRTNNLFHAIERSVVNPEIRATITDPVELALLEASLPEFLEPSGRLRPHIDEVFAMMRMRQRYFPNHYAFRKHELAVDNQMAQIFGDAYPSEFTTYAAWRDRDAFGQFDYEQYVIDMQRSQAYNYPQAHEIFHLQMQVFRSRWSRPPIALNIGYAQGEGEVKLALCHEYPFKQMRTYKFPRSNQPIGHNLEQDPESQDVVSELVPRGPVMGGITGVDREPIALDEPSQDWAKNNTFPMGQKDRGSPEYQEFEAIQGVVSDAESSARLRYEHNVNLVRFWVDASDKEMLEVLKYMLPGGKADFIILSGVLMQMPQEQIFRVFRNLAEYSTESALASVSEWAVADRKQPSGIRPINENWWHRPGAFANFLVNLHKPGSPPIHMGSFLNRRGEEMLVTDIGRKLLTGEETLESINF